VILDIKGRAIIRWNLTGFNLCCVCMFMCRTRLTCGGGKGACARGSLCSGYMLYVPTIML